MFGSRWGVCKYRSSRGQRLFLTVSPKLCGGCSGGSVGHVRVFGPLSTVTGPLINLVLTVADLVISTDEPSRAASCSTG